METRVALMSILVEESEGHPTDSVRQLNELLHVYGQYIIGRMGIPYREKHVNIISIAMDAPQDAISALSGKIGRLTGVTVKTTYTK
ncbi:MAG: iron-only hydrogenase system regulator [Lachnospiraceae bacterium]|nr:iron-only hydrogenase system regulator [Lachnospiraceae bacterium]